MQNKKFHIITLGCKVNQYESESLREAWLRSGHIELETPTGADFVVINSCAITAKAVSDLRNLARRVRRKAPACRLLVTGCAAQALPEELKELPLDELVPQSDKVRLLDFLGADNESPVLEEYDEDQAISIAAFPSTLTDEVDTEFWEEVTPDELREEEVPAQFRIKKQPDAQDDNKKRAFPKFSVSGYKRSRAVLKIHDGCSQHCTYCIVPQGRGASVSRPWPDILAEAARLINAGFKEIVLNGVNLRQYGLDLPGKPDFWDLLLRLERAFSGELAASDGGIRFRISSLEPGQLGEKALDVLAASRLIAPQLHLSLQSCSPRVLSRMGRGHYDPALLPDFLSRLRQIWPMYGLGADFITGFPGETDEDFEITIELCKLLPLTYAHVFPYSERPGTLAAKMPGKLPQPVKKERALRLRSLMATKQEDFIKAQMKLPGMWLVSEGEAGRGVNEFYTECRIMNDDSGKNMGQSVHGHNLIHVKPVAMEKSMLLVKELPQNAGE